MRSLWMWAAALAAISLSVNAAAAQQLDIVARSPSALTARIHGPEPGQLYRVVYESGGHKFVWENLEPDAEGLVELKDDRHLRPEHRLRCESQTGAGDPVLFDDKLKAPIAGRRRLTFGVPVSTFGGAGYLVPGISDLKRDDFGNFWLYLDHPPYAIMKYDADFDYQLALLVPGRVVAFDVDGDGNVYVLHPGNWISKHGPLGEALNAWDLPFGRTPGSFVLASGMAIDRAAGLIYLSDEVLGRVQRFDLEMQLQPLPHTAWGWIGREDLAYTRAGEYRTADMYYQLDRPGQLALDGRGHLFVSSEHYVSEFDLASGSQMKFGRNPVLGWGGTFSDSAFSSSAALDGHWQRQWLAGVDERGRVYLADRENDFLVDPRLQVFDADGSMLQVLDLEHPLRDSENRPVYITAVKGLATGDGTVWVVDAAGRVYRGPEGAGLQSGGRLFLGAGAAGRQFDLSAVNAESFRIEVQAERVLHRSEGRVLAYRSEERGTSNCERDGEPTIGDGDWSMWVPSRLGEPFRVTLFDRDGSPISPEDYVVQFEEKPGLFGTHFDFFRVRNLSGRAWREVRFQAEALHERTP